MPTAPTDLAAEIAELESELDQATRAAARAKLNSADHEAAFLSERLQAKKAELRESQEAESASVALQQHAHNLLALTQLENDISKAKAEIDTLRVMITELPTKLSHTQWQLGQLLQQYSKLKQSLGI